MLGRLGEKAKKGEDSEGLFLENGRKIRRRK
jgi:hypothetical protein